MHPNFFIIGAPKCGTTALAKYLSDHPDVFFSVPKEPAFWATDYPNLCRQTGIESLEDYRRLFAKASDRYLAIGEGSACYLNSNVAVANILQFNPQSRFIVMLRNPIEMVYAWHGELLFNFDENIRDFEEAWGMQAIRRDGANIPPGCRSERFLQYSRVAQYHDQLERLMTKVPAEQRKIIIFDDFVANPENMYREVLRFLELPFDSRRDFAPVRESQVQRFPWLAKLMLKPPRLISAPITWIKHAAQRNERGVLGRLRKSFWIKRQRAPLRPEFVQKLREFFAPDIQRVSTLLGRDLTHWVAPGGRDESPSTAEALPRLSTQTGDLFTEHHTS